MVGIPLDYNCQKVQTIKEDTAFIDEQAISLRMRNIYMYLEKLMIVFNWSKVNHTETGI